MEEKSSNNNIPADLKYSLGDDDDELSAEFADISQSRNRSESRKKIQEHEAEDIKILEVMERNASVAESTEDGLDHETPVYMPSKSRQRSKSMAKSIDNLNPVYRSSKTAVEQPISKWGKLYQNFIRKNWLIRYFVYIVPVTLLLLIPILVVWKSKRDLHIGGIRLFWMTIWWIIIWLTLWGALIVTKCLPYIVSSIVAMFSNDFNTWKNVTFALTTPLTFFFWALSVLISFGPIASEHSIHHDQGKSLKNWEKIMLKILLAIFIGTILNLIEKILLQFIAINFHRRQYADRIIMNKFAIDQLTQLYQHSRNILQTPGYLSEKVAIDSHKQSERKVIQNIQSALGATFKGAQWAAKTAGSAIQNVASDFGGKSREYDSAKNVVLQLLTSVKGSQILARQLFKTYAREEPDSITLEDLKLVYRLQGKSRQAVDEESEACFQLFDRDANGSITCEEMELACVDFFRERKSIFISLKDLDSALAKLNGILMVLVVVGTILIFVGLILTVTGVVTTIGTTFIGLSWLLSGTAQELLTSLIFVFVKHPFDVGDRIELPYNGLPTSMLVKEIFLMYTEFKGLDGKIYQAPNNMLNQLFILNHRRSGPLSEAITLTFKFGTSISQIIALKDAQAAFLKTEPRDFKPDIVTEVIDIPDLEKMVLKMCFFHKSNWQNEGYRCTRRNKFLCALMTNIQALGIESPLNNLAGRSPNFPVYSRACPALAEIPNELPSYSSNQDVPPANQDDNTRSSAADDEPESEQPEDGTLSRQPSSAMKKRDAVQVRKHVDFSLGASNMILDEMTQDLELPQDKSVSEIVIDKVGSDSQKKELALKRQKSEKLAKHNLQNKNNPTLNLKRLASRRNRFESVKEDKDQKSTLQTHVEEV